MSVNASITLSGADERTPLSALERLADQGAEIGLLWTHSPDGRNRYPSLPWLRETILALGRRCAVHVYGKRARWSLLCGCDLSVALAAAGRIQVNGVFDMGELADICAMHFDQTIITQHAPDNAALLGVTASNHALLVDGSGGRGLLPAVWERPDTAKAVGFAGGLTPENLAEQLPRIAAVARGEWWVDCESGLRTADDWFDVARAEAAVRVFNEWRATCT